MKTITIIFMVCLGLQFCPGIDAAPLGTGFNYNGRLNDGGGPANGRYDFRFILYNAMIGGSQIGVIVTNVNVVVSNGLFSTVVDLGPGIFDGSAYWMELGVRTNASPDDFTTLSPRQPILSTPNSLYAFTAGNAAAVAANSITTASLQNNSVTPEKLASGGLVTSLNGLRNDVTLAAGAGVSITPSGNTLTLASSGTDNDDWKLTGNSGTLPGTHFLGTRDNQPLTLRVNNTPALLLRFNGNSPNIIAGGANNSIGTLTRGSVILGGGEPGDPNVIEDNVTFGTITGGQGNRIRDGAGSASIGGGFENAIAAAQGVIGGGSYNRVSVGATTATIGGGYANSVRDGAFSSAIAGGSYNIISTNASSSFIGGGYGNTAFAPYTTIGGGLNNSLLNSTEAVIGGGEANRIVSSYRATIGGGINNLSDFSHNSFIGGGEGDQIMSSDYTTIGGGVNNLIANNGYSTIAGGAGNAIQGAYYSTIAGGSDNLISTNAGGAFIGGGENNAVLNSAGFSMIGGGQHNAVSNSHLTVIAGGEANRIAISHGATIGGGTSNRIDVFSSGSVVAGGEENLIGPNAAHGAVAGGRYNVISNASLAFIGGGGTNQIVSSDHATIGGGHANVIESSSRLSVIAGGAQNNVSGAVAATIGGGNQNQATGWDATIAGGSYNTAAGNASTIGGGFYGGTTGEYSTIPGGYFNRAAGDSSLAAGHFASADHDSTFVWADISSDIFHSARSNEFAIRASGGVRIDSDRGISLNAADRPIITRGFDPFDTNAPDYKQGHGRWGLFMEFSTLVLGMPTRADREIAFARYNTDGTYVSLAHLDQDGNFYTTGAVNPPSDRNVKTNFATVNARQILECVSRLPIQTWSYTNSTAVRHIGPVAQDFHAAFGVGADDKHISTIDADGVALAAIQGLHQIVEEQAKELRELREKAARVAELEKRLALIEKALQWQSHTSLQVEISPASLER